MLPQNLAALAAADPLDQLALGEIAGASYYEMHFIVKVADGRTSVVGRASDWPVIQRDAEIAALKAELAALKAALRAEPAPAAISASPAAEPTPPPVAEPAPAHSCPECGKTFAKAHGLNVHRASKHRPASEPAPEPRPATIVVEPAPLPTPPFRCARCQSDAHAPSRKRPELCIRCNARAEAETTPTGYPVAA